MEGVLILWKVRRRLNAGAQGQGLGLDLHQGHLGLHKGLQSEGRGLHPKDHSILGAQSQTMGLDLYLQKCLHLESQGLHSEDQIPAHAPLNSIPLRMKLLQNHPGVRTINQGLHPPKTFGK